ncbi:MAG: CoA transferase [Deltaproteobacteria bacterium]|uniref:CoA transferase n=1 Tax=Candidatus Zymogenus saltonus TaxID=2844893 RepID=A0A9D8KH86_9DELT|nr:CoA transferase [Candidatus Zymogenus saltonus]
MVWSPYYLVFYLDILLSTLIFHRFSVVSNEFNRGLSDLQLVSNIEFLIEWALNNRGETVSEKPLKGIRVVDLTRILSGPYCTMILKNLGAEVIKVERPYIGDDARLIGPFRDDDLRRSAYFMSLNAGKMSLSVNLKTEEGSGVLKRLIERSDVLVENYRPGTLAGLGFSEEDIMKINPEIVYASVSGFGHTGPDSKKGAYDMIVQALSGIISITGTEKGETVRVGTSVADIFAGMFAAIGVLTSLYRRCNTAAGARVDVAMLDGTVAVLENAIARYQTTGEIPGPMGKRHPSIAPFGGFRTADSEIIIAVGNDNLFEALCDVIGRPKLKKDDRFSTNELRTKNVKELTELINSALSGNTTDYWLERLTGAGIPCAKINNISDLFNCPQIRARNMLVPLDGEGDFKIAGNPVKIKGVPDCTSFEKAPALGEHNETVMTGVLGYSEAEVSELYEKGILFR